MDAPDISNIEAAPPSLAGDEDTITDMPPPPGLLVLLLTRIIRPYIFRRNFKFTLLLMSNSLNLNPAYYYIL